MNHRVSRNCNSMIVDNKWKTLVVANNAKFLISKQDSLGKSYEKVWRTATVLISLKSDGQNNYILTINYNTGKRLDIPIFEKINSYQVVPTSVRIIADNKKTSYCIKEVSDTVARNFKHVLDGILQAKKEESGRQDILNENTIGSGSNRSPTVAGNGNFSVPPKRKSSEWREEKKKMGWSCLTPEHDEANGWDEYGQKRRKAMSESKVSRRFKDFRKAQSEVRRPRSTCNTPDSSDVLEDGKENTSPDTMTRLQQAMNKNQFYGSSSQADFLIKNYSHPSPKTTPSPCKRNLVNKPAAVKNQARRSLILMGDAKPQEDRDSGVLKNIFDDNLNLTQDDTPTVDLTNQSGDQAADGNGNVVSMSAAGDGFQNLGNTCYMNSVLQSLFGIRPFQLDLCKSGRELKSVLPSDSLLMSLVGLERVKPTDHVDRRYHLRRVKRAIAASADQFSGFSQHDAHEFLRLCLDVLQEEVKRANRPVTSPVRAMSVTSSTDEEGEEVECPVEANFAFTVQNRIACDACGAVTKKEEKLYDLPVDFPQRSEEESEQGAVELQHLIDRSFESEQVEYKCEKCRANQATVSKHVTRLPRVAMVYLKRYAYNQTFDHSEKIRQRVALARYIGLEKFCTADVKVPATGNHLPDELIGAMDDDPDRTRSFDAGNPQDGSIEIFRDEKSTPEKATDSDSVAEVTSQTSAMLLGGGGRSNVDVKTSPAPTLPSHIDPDKIYSMSEDDQIMLAMQLSMQEHDASMTELEHHDFASEYPWSPIALSTGGDDDVTSSNNNNNNNNYDDVKTADYGQELDFVSNCHPVTDVTTDVTTTTSSVRTVTTSNVQRGMTSWDTTVGSANIDMFLSLDSEDDVFAETEMTPRVSESVNQQSRSEQPATSTHQVATESVATSVVPNHVTPEKVQSHVTPEKAVASSSPAAGGDEEDHVTPRPPNSYQLVSVISHKGGSSRSGHYISDVLTRDKSWKCYNDSFVHRETEADVLLGRQSTAYLCFYLHSELLDQYYPTVAK